MLGSESVIRRLSSTHRNVPASATERSRTPTFQVIASMLHVLQAEMATFAFYNVAIVLMQRARSLPAVLVVLVIGVIGTIAYFVKEAVRM